MAARVLLKTVSMPAAGALRLLSSSVISTLYWPLESSATLPGVAEVRISALSGALIGARPWEYLRKQLADLMRQPLDLTDQLGDSLGRQRAAHLSELQAEQVHHRGLRDEGLGG